MSIDLEWLKLDSSLANTLVDILNKQLINTPRPSFIGPVEVTSLEFGTAAPDVELVDLRDIYRDFLEADSDDESDNEDVKVTEGAEEDEDGYEWVSRKAARRGIEEGPAYHHLPPHVRYGRSPSMDLFASTPSLHGSPRDFWNGGSMAMSVPGLGDFRPSAGPGRPTPSFYRSARDWRPPPPPVNSNTPSEPSPSPPVPVPPQDQTRPNIQLHLHLNWHSNLRLTLTTSLLINYPSPSFMSLPIKLSVTGLVFNGEVAVAYEGARGRVHLCVLDEMDPYGPACRRERSQSSTPPDLDEDAGKRDGKPLPVGQRLLPSIFIESEIGQADKHVLKNVSRVERFIQDVIRKTVEEELVFPNFHTLILGDQSAETS
ncbi:hypothetical protein BJ138DRAFT_1144749 [Hygrophoropsis aurantiaca]|uniref:Uncharacterized protein n=1 Tax=Hygrophoropsis aurantiaca TaxID=72124 RepID=A0ACB8ALH6_9AGAM|nr:hypothetical protein BJ138DRAFT_1144749 [Hygrophoropsis aurantiaca]